MLMLNIFINFYIGFIISVKQTYELIPIYHSKNRGGSYAIMLDSTKEAKVLIYSVDIFEYYTSNLAGATSCRTCYFFTLAY